jgi:enamine deaminase RidA (YjgF/YER057c/UK114 family)
VEAAGGKIADIVQCTIYVSKIAHWSKVNDVYGTFFAGVPVLPARPWCPLETCITVRTLRFKKSPF